MSELYPLTGGGAGVVASFVVRRIAAAGGNVLLLASLEEEGASCDDARAWAAEATVAAASAAAAGSAGGSSPAFAAALARLHESGGASGSSSRRKGHGQEHGQELERRLSRGGRVTALCVKELLSEAQEQALAASRLHEDAQAAMRWALAAAAAHAAHPFAAIEFFDFRGPAAALLYARHAAASVSTASALAGLPLQLSGSAAAAAAASPSQTAASHAAGLASCSTAGTGSGAGAGAGMVGVSLASLLQSRVQAHRGRRASEQPSSESLLAAELSPPFHELPWALPDHVAIAVRHHATIEEVDLAEDLPPIPERATRYALERFAVAAADAVLEQSGTGLRYVKAAFRRAGTAAAGASASSDAAGVASAAAGIEEGSDGIMHAPPPMEDILAELVPGAAHPSHPGTRAYEAAAPRAAAGAGAATGDAEELPSEVRAIVAQVDAATAVPDPATGLLRRRALFLSFGKLQLVKGPHVIAAAIATLCRRRQQRLLSDASTPDEGAGAGIAATAEQPFPHFLFVGRDLDAPLPPFDGREHTERNQEESAPIGSSSGMSASGHSAKKEKKTAPMSAHLAAACGACGSCVTVIPPLPRAMLPALLRALQPRAAIVASIQESFNMVAHELRALKVPLVLARIYAFAEFWSEQHQRRLAGSHSRESDSTIPPPSRAGPRAWGDDAFTFTPGDSSSLADALEAAMADDAAVSRMRALLPPVYRDPLIPYAALLSGRSKQVASIDEENLALHFISLHSRGAAFQAVCLPN